MAGDVELDIDREFWLRYARTAEVLNLCIVLIDLAYVVGTWSSGAHRPILAALNIAALVGLIAGVATAPELRIAASPQRDLIFGAWCLTGTLLITIAVLLDGGLQSPLTWVLPLSVMFTATVHRPKLVVLSGVGALASYVLLGAVDGGETTSFAKVAVSACYIVALTYAASVTAHFRWSHYDAQIALRETLTSLADHDGLTGLLNHRSFHDLLDRHIAAHRGVGEPVSVLLVDLDHFKAVNDGHGHLVGDEVLKQVTRAILESIRTGDHAARVGGEEFCILLPAAGPDEARAVAERLRAAVAAITGPATITTSVGLSSASTASTTARELLDQADGALYEAKRTGRNRVCWLQVA
jgi:diguanylate cyclase (GGDEF)-like protein